MPISSTVAILDTLAAAASLLPKVNPPVPIYAIVSSDNLIPLTIPDSWGEFSPRYESQISDYPIETGAFAPYNKVRRPIGVSVTLVKTGSDVARFAWLTAIQQQEAQFPNALYTLVSPQAVYVDYAIQSISYETRPDKGSNILYLTINFAQVPQITSSLNGFTNVLEAKSTPVSQIGNVFSNAATAAQSALINASDFIGA
jgi:hypothetical protein